MDYVMQADDVMQVEKNTLHLVAMMADDIVLDRNPDWTLARVLAQAPGALAACRQHCPLGTVEFCRAWMRAVGVCEPAPVDYPECLHDALGRTVRRTTLAHADVGEWIKPVATKAWAAHPKHPGETGSEAVWAAPCIDDADWQAEWRVYVVDGRIVGDGRYDDREAENRHYDAARVAQWVKTYSDSGAAPAGYALDVALLSGRTVLCEVTDGWAIGYYQGSCAPRDYARLLRARWAQIANAS